MKRFKMNGRKFHDYLYTCAHIQWAKPQCDRYYEPDEPSKSIHYYYKINEKWWRAIRAESDVLEYDDTIEWTQVDTPYWLRAENKPKYNQDPAKGNAKFDAKKARMELLPARALYDVAKALTYGASKYDEQNWRKKGGSIQRYTGSLLRHINAMQRGEDIDEESGLLHSTLAACNALFILESQLQGYWDDDRIKDTEHDVYKNIETKWNKSNKE